MCTGAEQEADLLGELLAQAADALEQFAVLAASTSGNQAVADFQAEHIDRRTSDQLASCFGGAAAACCSAALGGSRQPPQTLAHAPGEIPRIAGEQQEHEVGHAGDQAEHAEDGGGDGQRPGVAEQLPDHLLPMSCPVATRGHHQTGGGGDDQRRDLRHQAVADGQQGVAAAASPADMSCWMPCR
jgi:hypothetical protein